MKVEVETPATALVQQHLNRNPRVVSYKYSKCASVFEVEIDTKRAIPRIVSAEARALNLDDRLCCFPYCA